MSGWPQEVFEAPLLRGLDAAARQALTAAGTIREIAAGTRIYREGDDADTFFVVLAGRVALRSVRRGDAEAAIVRVAEAGASFGEEASLQLLRRLQATVIENARVVELPASVFRRGAGRSGGSILARREERLLARAVTADLLRTMALTRELPREDFDMVLDAVSLQTCERGERIYGAGDRSDHAFFVVEGLIQIQDEDDDEVAVVAYLDRGDLFGDEDALAVSPRSTAAVSLGFSALLRLPASVLRSVVDRNAGLLDRARRLAYDRAQKQQRIVGEAAALTTQHVFKDVYRLKMARSLLVIDQDSCVRCGHCAWSCASTHDGVARLQRRGDKVVTRLAEGESTRRSLLVPNSCQHCKNPACMIDCPTGAIGRDPRGEVFIREDLCTGCGACAKACPWENIAMAPRERGLAALSATVAVKCDLCRDYDAPTCVRSCPTSALTRLDPNRDVADVADLLGVVEDAKDSAARSRPAPRVRDGLRRAAGLSWSIAGAAAIGIGIAGFRLQSEGGWEPGTGLGLLAGWTAAAATVGAALYAIPKRIPRMLIARRRKSSAARRMFAAQERAPRSLLRPLFGAHVVIGCVALAGALAHAGPRMAGLAGVLYGAFILAAALGIIGALLYAFVPAALTRLERDGALPEDLRGRREILVDDLYRQVSGRSDVLKALLDRVLLPYLRAPLGGLRLLASGRSLAQERDRVRARIDRMLEGRGRDRLQGLDAAIRTAVELRALGPRRLLSLALRIWLVPHILVSTATAVLLVAHILVMSGWP